MPLATNAGKKTMPTVSRADPSRADKMPWCANPFVEWLLSEGWNLTSTKDLVDGLCRRMVDGGLPLWRMFLIIRTLHPQVFATNYTWRRDTGDVEKFSAPYSVLETSMHIESPCATMAAPIHHTANLRQRLF